MLQLQLNEDISGFNKNDQLFIHHEVKEESKTYNNL